MVSKGTIRTQRIQSKGNVADGLTKPSRRELFKEFMYLVNLKNLESILPVSHRLRSALTSTYQPSMVDIMKIIKRSPFITLPCYHIPHWRKIIVNIQTWHLFLEQAIFKQVRPQALTRYADIFTPHCIQAFRHNNNEGDMKGSAYAVIIR
jgi:hypothetical protein